MSELTDNLRFLSTKKDGGFNVSRCPSSTLVEAADALEAQEARINELEKALVFYSQKSLYSGHSATRSCGCCSDWMEPDILEDMGDIAREALSPKPTTQIERE